ERVLANARVGALEIIGQPEPFLRYVRQERACGAEEEAGEPPGLVARYEARQEAAVVRRDVIEVIRFPEPPPDQLGFHVPDGGGKGPRSSDEDVGKAGRRVAHEERVVRGRPPP